MALQVVKIKDLKGKPQESSCSVKAIITGKGELLKSSTKKDYRKFTVQDGNTENDAIVVFVYKKEVLNADIGDAFIFRNLIYKGTFLVMTARSVESRTKMKTVATVELKSMNGNYSQSSETSVKGRIVQVSPKRKTKGDSLQYIRLKDGKGAVNEVAVWGHDIPNEGIITLTNLKSSKMADYGTSRGTSVMVHEDDSDDIEIEPEEVIISERFPGRKKGQLEAVTKIFSYIACVVCKTRKADGACHKCGSTEKGGLNYVCKILFEEDGILLDRTIFHDDIMKFIGKEDATERDIEDILFDRIGEVMTYFATDDCITSVQVAKDSC